MLWAVLYALCVRIDDEVFYGVILSFMELFWGLRFSGVPGIG